MTKSILFVIGAMLLAGCKKPDPAPETPAPDTADHTAPVIILNGKAKDTISLQSNYSDPGVTASDNKDGDLTASVIKSGTVNPNLTGNYNIEYNVRDAAGNIATKVSKQVVVKNDIEDLSANYAVACHCATIIASATAPPPIEGNSTYTSSGLASSTINNRFQLNGFRFGIGQDPYTLEIAVKESYLKVLNAASAEGLWSSSKSSFTVVSSTSGVQLSTQYTCTSIFKRQ